MPQEFDKLKNDQDVDEILRLAVHKDGSAEDLRSRLETSAAELGISTDALARAEQEYFAKKDAETTELASRQKRRSRFVEHFASFATANMMLIGIWYFSSSGHGSFWPIWPLLGWGLGGILPHFINAIVLNKDEEEREGRSRRRHR